MNRITIVISLLFLGTALYSCASSIPHSDASHQAWAQKHWTNIDLNEGREAYVKSCSGCHSLHSPLEHTEKEWDVLFAEMASKAKMTPQDSVSVLAYLEAFSKDTRLVN